MSGFINNIDIFSDEAITDSILQRDIRFFSDENVTKLREYIWAYCKDLRYVNCPNVSSIYSVFQNNSSLVFVDFGKSLTNLIYFTPYLDYFKTLILRSESVCTYSSLYLNSEMCIYVPSALVDSYKADSKWGKYEIRAIEDYEGNFENDVITDTWEEIASHCADGSCFVRYKIGQTKDVTLTYDDGTTETITMEIADFCHDELSDGSGYAPITWIAKTPLAQKYAMDDHVGSRPTVGWGNCNLRTILNDTIFNSFSSDLQIAIKEVNKLSDGGYNNQTIQTSVDKCWIPSISELSINYSDKGQGYIYPTISDKKLALNGTQVGYWTRSAFLDDSNYKGNYYRLYNGSFVTKGSNANSTWCVRLCFCT